MSRPHIPQSVRSERQEFNPVLDQLFKNAGIQTPSSVREANTQKWEQMDTFYQEIGSAIITIGEEVNKTIGVMRELGVDKNAEVAVTVSGLTKDLEQFTSELLQNRKRHEGLTGPVKDGEELALCLSIFNDYVLLNDRFRAMTFPAMLTLTEHLTEAVAKAKSANDLQDPNVVTDVEVKEVKTDETKEGAHDGQ